MNNNPLSFLREYTLVAQTPLIHFQHNQDGATLRATEVKPKLDAFLIKKAQEQGIDISGWLISKEHRALNYKMRLSACGEQDCIDIGFKTPYDIYYGNMGSNGIKKKAIDGDVKLKIVCVIPGLVQFIDKYVSEFFIVTNFGTMSNKGFGSYIVQGKTPGAREISEAMRKQYGAKKCYSFNGGKTPFKQIKTVYSIIKSGMNFRGYQRSLLFLYMHDKYEFGNEKAWLKQEKIAPAIGRNKGQQDNEFYYVRALLGITDHIEFINDIGDRKNKTVVTIKNTAGKIDRLMSPIIFKVIGDRVYMVANRIDDNIFGATFEFRSSEGNGTLSVPSKEELGESFIDEFMAYAVSELNKGIADGFVTADRENRNSHIRIEEV